MIENIKQSFNNFVNDGLNDRQQEAVIYEGSALLIIAGAGSGKTRVITSRIANLVINQNINPRSIVALTFTNKAAGEMKERLQKLFGGYHKMPFIGTFHSYCLMLLRTNPSLLPFSTFSILDADDQIDLIKKIIKKYALAKNLTATNICYTISNYKNKTFAGNVSNELELPPLLKEVYLEYEAEKAQAHCFDFDDLILYVLKILQKNHEFRQQFHRMIRHILVDEYQDTSAVQHHLLKCMAQEGDAIAIDSLCAVGDEDQSIYSWRGATVTNMLKFQQEFAPVQVIKIEQNYRSVQPILDAANAVITNNRLRNPKTLWSARQASNRILALSCRSNDQEASMIAQFIGLLRITKPDGDIAILYRTHFQSRSIEEALIHKAIPYKIIGGIRFYERKEIKDLLAYLRLCVNPYDKISLLRVVNTPARGLGQKFEEQLLHEWNINPFFDFKQLLGHMIESGIVTGAKQEALTTFLALFNGITPTTKPSTLLDALLAQTRYISYLASSYDPREADTKIENVQEFMQGLMVFESKHEAAEPDIEATTSSLLESFLYEVSLLQQIVEDETATNVVQMMTLHAAKGLEFDTIVLAGLEEGILPSSKSLNTNEELEEERRLMYVGITRAREYLLLINARSRFTYGQVVDQVPSRFLDEIPAKLLQHIDLEATATYQHLPLIQQWLTSGTQSSSSATRRSATVPVTSTRIYASPPRNTQGPKPTAVAKPAGKTGSWSKNQTVGHASFGTGIVVSVEHAPEDEMYITALFKGGKKKILSRFLKRL